MDNATLKNELIGKKSKLTDNARIVLAKRYLKKNDNGDVIETPEEMFFRVAENIALAEKKYGSDSEKWTRIFYDMMANLEFLPNSPTLMNAGRQLQQLSACFVMSVGDSMEEIFEAVKNTALIQKSGGGTGFSFSNLRPANDRVKSTMGVSSGPLSFMNVFDAATEAVKQSGIRRGANMGLLRADHPDILDFISIKEKDGVLSNFNISVAITKEFMEALDKNEEYSLINPRSKEIASRIKASEVFDKIIDSAWRNGEPGVVFIDRMNDFNPTPHVGRIEACNPCLTGDTLVAVADGRVAVPIKQLAEEGKDVPVYCRDEDGKIVIRMMRRPRMTAESAEIYKTTFDDGNFFKATANHEIMLLNGHMCRVFDFKYGDSLHGREDLKEKTIEHNHKIISIEKFDAKEPVYNGTVDEFHNYYFGGYKSIIDNKEVLSFINGKNCGEQPLLSMEACNLGSINLSLFIKSVNAELSIDWDRLKETTRAAVRFLDDVIDMNKYPLPEIDKMTKGNRKIGLGVMGFSDLLVKLHIPYNSSKAINTAESVMQFIRDEGRKASMELVKKRGAFPNFKGSIYDGGPEIRNATITTIAPTGTLSMIASCSSGVEPLFALVYEKNVLDNKKFLEVHSEFLSVAKNKGFYSEDLIKTIHKIGSVKSLDVPHEIKEIFVTAHDIAPIDHVSIQAAFQKYTDNAVSKTVNFRHDATKKEVEDVYRYAYKMGCKGVTVYRDGSRSGQVLTVGSSEENKNTVSVKDFEKGTIIAKDIKLPGIFDNGPTHIIKKEGKKFYLHFSYLPDDRNKKYPICIWIYTNQKYGANELRVCNRAAQNLQKLAQISSINNKFIKETLEKANQDYPHNRLGRMISLCLRHGVKREDILESLLNIEGDNVSTLLTAVRKFLSKTLENGTILKNSKCPDCESRVKMENGCMTCESPTCGWSAC